jgi:hypothetical protein
VPIETVTFISDLNPANPVGSTDKVQTLDDHARNTKLALLNTFPNITGAVTASHTELNALAAGGSTGTGLLVRQTSPTINTPTITTPTIADGSGIAGLNASNLASGTVPDARFPATLPAVSGANLTNLNASNLASGAVPDGRLSSNVPLKNAANTFTENQTLSKNAVTQFIVQTTGAFGAVTNYITNSVNRGYFGAEGAAGNLMTGTAAGDLIIRTEGGALRFGPSSGVTFSLSSAGVLTTPNASAAEPGYKGMPEIAVSSSRNSAATDAGSIMVIGGASVTYTIVSGTHPTGTVLTFLGNHTSGSTIAISGGTMYLLGAGYTLTGNRTLAYGGMGTAIRLSSGNWVIGGPGLS